MVILFGLARRTANKSRKYHYFTLGREEDVVVAQVPLEFDEVELVGDTKLFRDALRERVPGVRDLHRERVDGRVGHKERPQRVVEGLFHPLPRPEVAAGGCGVDLAGVQAGLEVLVVHLPRIAPRGAMDADRKGLSDKTEQAALRVSTLTLSCARPPRATSAARPCSRRPPRARCSS